MHHGSFALGSHVPQRAHPPNFPLHQVFGKPQ